MLRIDATGFVTSTTNPEKFASVNEYLFGGTDVNKDPQSAVTFLDAVEHLNLRTLRFPGGTVAEEGSFQLDGNDLTLSVSGGDRVAWVSSVNALRSNFLYDLTYPNLVHPDVLNQRSDILGLDGMLDVAVKNSAALELIIPVERYSTFDTGLNGAVSDTLIDRFASDFNSFLSNLASKISSLGAPEAIILDFGNENLVWRTKFTGQTLDADQKFDATAVDQAMTSYFGIMTAALSTLDQFRNKNPSVNLDFAVQLPFMNGIPGTDLDPQDVFLANLNMLPANLAAQIDGVRFHPLSLSMQGAATYENWYSDEIVNASNILRDAKDTVGLQDDILVIADAWSTDGRATNSDLRNPSSSMQSAISSIAAIATLAEMGVDYATAWGIAVPYKGDVGVSYYDFKKGVPVYTPRGEALRMAGEVLPGMQLVTPREYLDAWGTGDFNLQAFSDNSKMVIFLSANDLPGGAQPSSSMDGYWVHIDLANFGAGASYVWIETLNTKSGASGEAVVWNPALDSTAVTERGESWVIFDGTTISVRLQNDFEMIRIVAASAQPGDAPLYLIGDSRRGFGVVDDLLLGGFGDDLIYGLTGSDTINTGAGKDEIYGGDGSDVIYAGAGSDQVHGGSGNETISGGADSDLLFGDAGGDVLHGDQGADTILGGVGDDLIFGDDGSDQLFGGDGADQIWGGVGSDVLRGEEGSDVLFGGLGTDTIDGGAGSDQIYGGPEKDDLRDVIYGGDGDDLIFGGAGNDEASGGLGDDTINGDFGSDTLIGNQGADVISGGPGADVIFGNDGADWINGGFGSDKLNGGSGADAFFHLGIADHGSDWIQDYSALEGDRLVLGLQGATIDQLRANYGYTVDAQGTSAGNSGIAEAFVVYQPTGQILWALVDGAAQDHIYVNVSGSIFDLNA